MVRVRDIYSVLKTLPEMGGLISQLGIELGTEKEQIVCRMQIQRRHTGAPGVAHGGALSALIDTALGAQALVHAVGLGKTTSTVELKVNFLRPAKEGQTLVTSSTVQHAGRSLLVVSGLAKDEATGEPVVFGLGTFNLYTGGHVSESLQKMRAQTNEPTDGGSHS